MKFGTMNEYRPLNQRFRWGMPYPVSRGSNREWAGRAVLVLCLTAAALAVALV